MKKNVTITLAITLSLALASIVYTVSLQAQVVQARIWSAFSSPESYDPYRQRYDYDRVLAVGMSRPYESRKERCRRRICLPCIGAPSPCAQACSQ
jgi:hypothetical protein